MSRKISHDKMTEYVQEAYPSARACIHKAVAKFLHSRPESEQAVATFVAMQIALLMEAAKVSTFQRDNLDAVSNRKSFERIAGDCFADETRGQRKRGK